MTETEKLQTLFLQMPWQRRIGEIGVNLLNIHSFETLEDMAEYARQLSEQSRKFIEWTLRDIEAEKRAQLLMLDQELSRWQINLSHLWLDANERKRICQTSKGWSDRLIEMSGLLYETPNVVLKVAEPKP